MDSGWKKWALIIAIIMACIVLAVGYFAFTLKAPGNPGAGNASTVDASSGLNSSGGVADETGINDWYTDPGYPYKPKAQPISVAEAAEQVRNFIHDGNANVTLDREDTDIIGSHYYDMRSGNSTFKVITSTGEVACAGFMDNYTGGSTRISEDEARSIALAYAREHYYGFDAMKGMRFFSSELLDHGSGGKEYSVTYRQVVDDVQTLNAFSIYIDAETGKVHSFYCTHIPTNVSLAYTVSKREAVRNAVSGIGDIMAEETSGDQESTWAYRLNASVWLSNSTNATVKNIKVCRMVMLDKDMAQHAAWSVELDASWPVSMPGAPASEDGFHYWISVDGRSGEVIGFEHCL